MATTNTNNKHAIAVLNMPHKIGDQIIKAKFVEQKLTGNIDFPLPYPFNVCSLAQFNSDLTALDAAEANAINRTVGAAAIRDAALHTIMLDLKGLKGMVQAKADLNPTNAESIIKTAGFDVKLPTIHQKQKNEAISDNVPGVVDVTAEGSGAHEWQMSKDQLSITTLDPTTISSITLTGLTTDDIWYFRNRKIGRIGGMHPWSAWVLVKIK